MALGLLIFAVAFAAACILLTVRIMNRRERWAKWTLAATLLLPVFYVTSFGLAGCLCQQWILPQRVAWIMFRPVTWLAVHGQPPVRDTIRYYAIACGDNQNITEFHIGNWPVRYQSISPSPIVYEMIHSKKTLPSGRMPGMSERQLLLLAFITLAVSLFAIGNRFIQRSGT